jgi:dipeptidyl-peptidase-3
LIRNNLLAVLLLGIYDNMGNYKSFGDSKFVPRLPVERLEALILASQAATRNPAIVSLWHTVRQKM